MIILIVTLTRVINLEREDTLQDSSNLFSYEDPFGPVFGCSNHSGSDCELNSNSSWRAGYP